jgi:signal transduction histidine kinase
VSGDDNPKATAMPNPRSRRVLATAIFLAAAVTVLNVTLWLQYRDTRSALEAELARRLESVAQTLGAVLDPEQVVNVWHAQTELPAPPASATDSFPEPPDVPVLRAQLASIAETADLANITLYDQDGRPFLDVVATGSGLPLQDPLYRAEVVAALLGSSAHTPLYRSGSEYLMAGYAPLQGGLSFAVGVEADARFFASLRRLGQSLFLLGAGSVAVLVMAGVLFLRVHSRLARAEAAVQRAETLAAMGRMAAAIAHEIRNPLGIIRGTATRLKKLYDDPERPDEKFDYIADEVDRLSAVLDGYLGFARDEPPRLARLDLTPLVQRTLRLMQPELDGARVTLSTDLPTSCNVAGDPQRLRQLLMNVILNAVQAMDGGGKLHVQLQEEASWACLACEDTGGGIPPPLRERVFEPFFTTREKGSGLGLAIVRRIVDEHRGEIRLGDAPGGGTRVEVRLPRA